jgi:hypothetical protein
VAAQREAKRRARPSGSLKGRHDEVPEAVRELEERPAKSDCEREREKRDVSQEPL